MNYPNVKIDIVLLSCNRVDNTKKTIERLYNSVKYPDKIRLIVVDNESIDGTYEYLLEEKNNGRVHVLESCPSDKPITLAYNIGFKYVESDLFIMQQDDIDIPKLEPKDVIEQLIELIENTKNAGSVGCRIERIPNIDWNGGDNNIVAARKSASAYFRIQYKEDYIKMGMLNDKKDWDDINFCAAIRSIGKECYWAKNLWASHSRGYCLDRGYLIKPRRWGTGIHSRTRQAHIDKPYPIIDPKTNIPLYILNKDKKVDRPYNSDINFFGFKMRTRLRYYDEKILIREMDKDINMYRIPNNPKLVIDIGAHIGGTSIFSSNKGAHVISFEPELYNYETLCYNVRRNRMRDRIECVNLGVGTPGVRKLYIHNRNSGATSSYLFNKPNIDYYQTIVCISIKDVFNNYVPSGMICDVLKMDCEGTEEEIIRDLDDDIVSKINQISVEFHQDKNMINELINILSKWYIPENTSRYEWVFRKK